MDFGRETNAQLRRTAGLQFEVGHVSIELIELSYDGLMLIGCEVGLDLLPFSLDLQLAPQLLVGDMVLFDLFVEGKQVLDLDVGQGLDESLVTSIVDPDILMYLSLAFFVHLR